MKKLFFVLTLSVLAIGLKAESFEKSAKIYIEISSLHNGSTPIIDTGCGKGTEQYKTETGETIIFHSPIGAVNWFVSKGWKLESESISAGDDRLVKMYVISKEVPIDGVKSNERKYIKEKK